MMSNILKAMSDYVFTSRYARYNENLKRRLTWEEVVSIVEEMHIKKFPQIEPEIRWSFDLSRKKKVLGSQRGLQFGGDPVIKHNARLYNCSASYCDRPRFFQESMYLLLCGCGVGFSVQKHHVAKLPKIQKRSEETKTFIIPDNIEGWSDAIGVLLSSFFVENQEFPEFFGYKVIFDPSQIRPEGSDLSSGVGKAPGPKGLMASLKRIEILLNSLVESKSKPINLRPINAYDIVMHSSDAVLSGGVRRSSCIALFSHDDDEMLKAKTGDWRITNPQRGRSNNSVVLVRNEVQFDYFKTIMEKIKQFGEPGFLFVENKEVLVNPCAEIGLFAYETFEDEFGKTIYDKTTKLPVTGRSGWAFCNLIELNGKKIRTIEEFEEMCRAGAIIGTCQAGYTNFPYLGEVTEKIVKKEALMGVSITGIMDSPDTILNAETQQKMAQLIIKVNEEISKKIGINAAARVTTVKPAGTTSLILGTASGIHPHHAKRYFRRVQSNKNELPLQFFKLHNPKAVEESQWSANKSDEIITFCIEVPKGAKVKNQINAIELLEAVKLTQQNWVKFGTVEERCVLKGLTHNVSNTIHIKDDEWETVTKYIFDNRKLFAGISLLPIHGDKDYVQAPNCAVYTASEIQHEYGEGSMLASGLIVDGLQVFKNLWIACDCVLGIGEALFPEDVYRLINSSPEEAKKWNEIGITIDTKYGLVEGWLKNNIVQIDLKRDWIRRAKQFAKRYFENNVKKMTYCLKDIVNLKLWLDLNREYEEVDYTKLLEEKDNTKLQETIACSGGSCEII